jgi:ABC-2 type transport system ATP-binding protein
MLAIQTENLTKDFSIGFWRSKRYRALDGLTLGIEQGETFGFLGPNGAGKTTTLKLLMQLIYPTSGRAEILGRPAGDVRVKRRIGYLPESPYFYDYLTAEELLRYFASLLGYDRAVRRKRVSALLDEVGIGGERRLQLRKFSKGMLQRVGIAQALLNDPEVIFLDEPMSGLDPLGRRDVRNLILKLRDRGRTVFFSSHVLADAEALCSRVAILAAGRLVASGTMADITAFQVRGWELIVGNLTPESLARHAARIRRVNPIADRRYALELPLSPGPDRLLSDLIAEGAHLVSLNPVRDTLEDFFVRQVQNQPSSRRGDPSVRLKPDPTRREPDPTRREAS